MPIDLAPLSRSLPFLPPELLAEFAQYGEEVVVDKGSILMRQGQYVKVIPGKRGKINGHNDLYFRESGN